MISDKDIYSDKVEYAHFFLYGSIENNSHIAFADFVQKVELDKSIKMIIIHIDSFGGNITEKISIINTIKMTKIPVVSIVEGNVMSAAASIFLHSKYRIMSNNSIFMMHEMSYCLGYIMHDEQVDSLINNQYISDDIFNGLKNSKLTDEQINDLKLSEKFLTAQICLKYGLCDHIYEPPVKKRKAPDTPPTLENEVQFLDSHLPTLDILENILLHKEIIIRFNGYYPAKKCDYILECYNGLIGTIRNTQCIVYGILESIGSDFSILAYVVCDNRYMMSNAIIALDFHNIKFDIGRNIDDMYHNSKVIESIIVNLLITYTKLPKDVINRSFIENVIITAKDALKYGMCDKII